MLESNRWFLGAIVTVAACGGRSGLDALTINVSIGGIAAFGGSEAIGGLPATGGTVSTWAAHTGGKVATGGTASTGGRPSAGGAGAIGGKPATGGTNWTGGNKAVGGAASICARDADCTLCSYSGLPTNQTVCYCPSNCGVLTPMTNQACGTLTAAWSAYCVGLPSVCYTIDCIPRESPSCVNGVCTTQPGIGGATGAGGNSSSGGTTATGGTSSTGGTIASGGTTATGGTSSTGGTIASGGAAGAGCTSALETTKTISGQSLCVAKMVNIPIPTVDGGSTVYEIDATEVTQGQYDAWLATNPALPASTDAVCGWKSTESYNEQRTAVADADHHPVAYVDWCDAYSYCAGVGKRLCGRIGGGANYTTDVNAVGYDQWYTVCTSNGSLDASGYPYGEGYTPLVCNGIDAGQGGTVVVGTMTNCQPSWPGDTGVFDLSGNVAEWEDACDANSGMYDGCRIRGGAFDNLGFSAQPGAMLSCGSMFATNRFATVSDVGFRCCSL